MVEGKFDGKGILYVPHYYGTVQFVCVQLSVQGVYDSRVASALAKHSEMRGDVSGSQCSTEERQVCVLTEPISLLMWCY